MTSTNPKKRTVTIEIEYGSEWQQESDPLDMLLTAYLRNFVPRHKKNKVTITPPII